MVCKKLVFFIFYTHFQLKKQKKISRIMNLSNFVGYELVNKRSTNNVHDSDDADKHRPGDSYPLLCIRK